MSELAYNIHGDPFEVPATATAWRVRKMKQKGAPEVVYGRDGLPLVLPIEAGIEELRAEVSSAGRYRLDPVADGQRPIAEAPSAYVFLHPDATPRGEGSGPARGERLDSLEAMLAEITRANLETTRANSTLAQTVIERFAGMMESAAVLVRAAGGAHAPAPPTVLAHAAEPSGTAEVDEAYEVDEVAPAGLDLNALVAQVVTSVVTAVCSGQMKLPALGALLDWRRAAPVAQAESPAAAQAPTTPGADSPTLRPEPSRSSTAAPSSAAPGSASAEAVPAKANAAATALASLSPVAMGRLMAVQQVLTPNERVLALAILRELPSAELQAWTQELAQLPLDAAVAKIREVLHPNPTPAAGGVS